MKIVVWHRRDLRIHDNRALFEASRRTQFVIPAFCIDPWFFTHQHFHQTRYTFLYNSLLALDKEYRAIGSSLVILLGDPIQEIKTLNADAVFFNEDTNGEYGRKRDEQAIKDGCIGFCNDAIQREGKQDWKKHTKVYFTSNEYPKLQRLAPHGISSHVDIHVWFSRFLVQNFSDGGEKQGLERLSTFVRSIHTYPSSISPPFASETYTSRLSAYFSFGVISPRRAFQIAQRSSYWGKKFFISRLFWREHFTQKLIKYPHLDKRTILLNIEQYYDQLYEQNENLHTTWLEGRTGYPLVDAAMRALTQTGFINFRMRAMVASFYTYILRQPWKRGADTMFFNLTDADRAINYYQWQMQSGMTGLHPFRIYNPTKNLQTYDPECLFVKKYVPELRNIQNDIICMDPEDRIHSMFADAYYPPIVSFREASKKARTLYKSIYEKIKNNQE